MLKLCKKNIIYTFTILSGFLLIALPLYSTNKILDYIKVIGSVNIFHVFLVVALFLIVLKSSKGLIVSKRSIPVLILLVFTILNFIRGWSYGFSSEYLLRDLNLYILPIMIYYAFAYVFRKRLEISLIDVVDFLLIAQGVCTAFNIIIYLTRSLSFWGVSFFAGGRFGGNYQTLSILTIGYATYLLITGQKRMNRVFLWLYIILVFISDILAQSRMLMLLSVMSVAITIFINRKNDNNKTSKKRLLVLFICVVLGILLIVLLLNSNTDIARRLTGFNNLGEDASFLVRMKTLSENMKLMINNPFGLGLGYAFRAYDASGALWGDVTTNFIDYAYLTVGLKQGIFVGFLYIWVTLYPIAKIKKSLTQAHSKIYDTILWGYILLLIQSVLLSAQSLIGLSASTAIWILFTFCNVRHEV